MTATYLVPVDRLAHDHAGSGGAGRAGLDAELQGPELGDIIPVVHVVLAPEKHRENAVRLETGNLHLEINRLVAAEQKRLMQRLPLYIDAGVLGLSGSQASHPECGPAPDIHRGRCENGVKLIVPSRIDGIDVLEIARYGHIQPLVFVVLLDLDLVNNLVGLVGVVVGADQELADHLLARYLEVIVSAVGPHGGGFEFHGFEKSQGGYLFLVKRVGGDPEGVGGAGGIGGYPVMRDFEL